MAVIITKEDFSFLKPEDRCSLCDDMLRPPFLEWHGHRNLFICGLCCRHSKNGLMSDLIHVSAIVDMQRLEPAYHHFTLSRENIKRLEENERKQKKDIIDFPGKR